jgi:integrase
VRACESNDLSTSGSFSSLFARLDNFLLRLSPPRFDSGYAIATAIACADCEVRLDAGTTKNKEGRVFPMTAELRKVLKAQHDAHERLKKAGQICPHVFWRMIADERGGTKHPKPVKAFNKVWTIACRKAGCPGKIPHDMRRSAVRNLVRAGISERVAMRMTGHKTPSVFQRDNIVSDGDLREAARKLNVAAGR